MNHPWIFSWYNLIFAVPFLFAALYLLVYALSGLTFGDPEGEAPAAGDPSAETDGAAEAGADADAHAEPEAELHAVGDGKIGVIDTLGHHEPAAPGAEVIQAIKTPVYVRLLRRTGLDSPFYLGLLRFFGFGRVPLSILLMIVFFVWGFIGTAVNLLLRDDARFGAEPWLVSIPLAALGTAGVTRGLGQALGRWLPTLETYVHTRAALVGRTGEVLLPVDERFGLVLVRDPGGTSHRLPCRVAPGAPALAKGQAVRLTNYDLQARVYVVSAAAKSA